MTWKKELTQKVPLSVLIRGGLSEQLLDYLVYWYVQLYGNLVLSDQNMLFQGDNQQDIQLTLRPEHFTCMVWFIRWPGKYKSVTMYTNIL